MNEIIELNYGKTRCYCINETVLVDTDWAGTLQSFYRCTKENAIGLKQIKYLIVTHFHPDHMGIAQELADIGIRLVIFDEQRAYVHFSDRIFEKERVFFKPIDDASALHIPCSDSRRFLAENGIEGEVLHTVGHSEDSVSIILDNGTAIVGDLPPLFSVPAYNDARLEASWNSILSHNISRICYGHAKSDEISAIASVDDIR